MLGNEKLGKILETIDIDFASNKKMPGRQ